MGGLEARGAEQGWGEQGGTGCLHLGWRSCLKLTQPRPMTDTPTRTHHAPTRQMGPVCRAELGLSPEAQLGCGQTGRACLLALL